MKKKTTFSSVISEIIFAIVLRHCRVMTDYYVTFFKYQAKQELSPEMCLQLKSDSILLHFALQIT